VSRVVGEENDGQPDRVRCRVVKRQVGRPVSLAQRMRSSARARRRCRSFVRAVARRWCWWEAGDPPSVMSTGRRCAPWCVTSRRAMTRVRAGHPVRFSSPGIGHVGAVARFAVAVVGRGPRRLGEPVQGVGASCQVFCVRPCCWVRGRVRDAAGLRRTPPQRSLPSCPATARNFNNHRHRLHLLRRTVEHSYRHPDPTAATTLSCLEPEMALVELPMRISLSQAKLFSQDGLPGK